MIYCKKIIRQFIPVLFIVIFFCYPALSEELYTLNNHPAGVVKEGYGTPGRVKKIAGIEVVLISGAGIDDFWISIYEVTQELYESVTGKNPSYFKGKTLPVEQISWFDAVEFCNKLSIKNGLKPYYNIDNRQDDSDSRNYGIKWTVTENKDADGFRLPNSEEWELAARAGSRSRYYWGDQMNGDYCWYMDNSDKKTHPVGTRKPNAYFIFDITGNVREWCFDSHNTSYGLYRMVRDGHYSLDEEDMRLDKTDYRAPQFDFGFIGIRLVKNK